MRAGVSSKTHGHKRAVMAKRRPADVRGLRMRDVPIVDVDDGDIDALGAEFCHQVVRDLAEGGQFEGAERDGADPDDWLQAEADGAHLLRSPGR